MAFKDLLVHLDTAASCAGRVRLAIELARAHEAHLTGLYVIGEPLIPQMVLGFVPEGVVAEQQKRSKERAEVSVARFRDAAEREGIRFECRIAHTDDPDIVATVAQHARYVDLTVLGRPDPDDREVPLRLAEQVALTSGRPIMAVPHMESDAPAGPAERILVAWDGSREATRAVHDALPLLTGAASVIVLCVNPQRTAARYEAEPGADIALHLARHDVHTEVQQASADDGAEGEAILSAALDSGANLIVAGAYAHSRIRELVLGGVTRTLLRSTTVPVLMAH